MQHKLSEILVCVYWFVCVCVFFCAVTSHGGWVVVHRQVEPEAVGFSVSLLQLFGRIKDLSHVLTIQKAALKSSSIEQISLCTAFQRFYRQRLGTQVGFFVIYPFQTNLGSWLLYKFQRSRDPQENPEEKLCLNATFTLMACDVLYTIFSESCNVRWDYTPTKKP